jgi:hypothetical protein
VIKEKKRKLQSPYLKKKKTPMPNNKIKKKSKEKSIHINFLNL